MRDEAIFFPNYRAGEDCSPTLGDGGEGDHLLLQDHNGKVGLDLMHQNEVQSQVLNFL